MGEKIKMHTPDLINQFIQTWILWWRADEPISKHLLWGHPVFIWGRWGKGMELLGASVALYEIETFKRRAEDYAEETAPKFMVRSYRKAYQDIDRMFHQDRRRFFKQFAIIICLALPIFFVAWRYTGVSNWIEIAGLFIASFIATGLLGLVVLLIAAVFGPVARFIAWIGAQRNRGLVLGFVLIAIGLMFDVLAT